MKRFRGGIVFKAHRLVYHSPLGLGVIKKKKGGGGRTGEEVRVPDQVIGLEALDQVPELVSIHRPPGPRGVSCGPEACSNLVYSKKSDDLLDVTRTERE